jgi:hypothetical protein
MNESPAQLLRQMGITSPPRSRRLIEEIIRYNQLQLQDLVVLTEAASGHFAYTPILAAMAGADKVYAVTANSSYAMAEDVARLTSILAEYCHVAGTIEVVFDKTPDIIRQVDLVTNLGFVRPIDASFVSAMKEDAAIAFMREVWEQRPGEVDFEACRLHGIPVMGTDENHSRYRIFSFAGPLCLKMLFELEIEVYKNRLVIASGDRFGPAILRALESLGADAYLVENLSSPPNRAVLQGADAVIVADFASDDIFIGRGGHISAEELYAYSPGLSVLQFAGRVRVDELAALGIPFYPKDSVNSHQMAETFAYLGPRPVIELHAAGLKVGEVMCRLRGAGMCMEEVFERAPALSPAQAFHLFQ